MLKESEMLKKLQNTLSKRRFLHSMGVRDEAVKLAEHYGADTEKAKIAAILHDCAKYISNEQQLKKCRELGLALDEETMSCPPVIHAPLGAYMAKTEYGVEDEEILNAIRYHTVGRANMSVLEKIIYLADMIEPMRDYEGVDIIRRAAYEDLNAAMLAAIRQGIEFNLKKQSVIHTDTIRCLNSIIKETEGK
ncbi:MAG: bis(5'-nucleosyl)-tetraphosphatase (symmetrical) YqeK [Clostridiales bacterium]|nr:bis(5'-nucleosyl)-tetraphosphatase (symmetrical) YqeK [Clostridiales bacterium]